MEYGSVPPKAEATGSNPVGCATFPRRILQEHAPNKSALRVQTPYSDTSPRIVPITGKAALRFISEHHRHLKKLQGALFAVAVERDGKIVAVGTAGNPARVWQGTGKIAISRVAALPGENIDGHACCYCGRIYGALTRAARELGYVEAWTYTLPDEEGRSLVGAGFWHMGFSSGGEWSRKSRQRELAVCADQKGRWVKPLTREATIRLATPIVESIVAFAQKFARHADDRLAA
jgi:hypothetical protein